MNIGRIILLGLVLATGVGVFVLFAIGGEPKDMAPMTSNEAQNQTVGVLVASRDISRGDRLSEKLVKWVEWPQNAVPSEYITKNDTQFYKEMGTTLARSAILKGEPIFEARLVRPGDGGVLSALLVPGMRAVTLGVDVVGGSGGFILPDDRVDLYFTSNSRGGTMPARLLYEGLRVIAIDQATATKKDVGALKARTVTLEVAPNQVRSILTARESGKPTLVLRSVFQPEPGNPLFDEIQARDVVIVRYGQAQAF